MKGEMSKSWDKEDRTSSESEKAASPILDGGGLSVRRRESLDVCDDSAVTSLATADDLAFLNSQTKQEIDLDLSKYPSLDFEVQSEII